VQPSTDRLTYLIRSSKGLVLVTIALIVLITAAWGSLSGPMVEWGAKLPVATCLPRRKA